MKKILFILILLAFINVAFACVELIDGEVYYNNTNLCNDVYFLDKGITIHGDNFIFDCNNAVIRGDFFQNSGIMVINSNNVTLKNCNIMLYRIGINVQNSENITLTKNHLLKNLYGTKFFNSKDGFIYNADSSLTSPIKIVGSSDNFIYYFNKKIQESLYSDNEYNKPLHLTEKRKKLDYTPNYIVWLNPFFR